MNQVAFVTGASRGIGKSIAIWLGRAGFDVAITARTVDPGEAREHSPSVRFTDATPLPGSLAETAAEITATGARCMVVPADILDEESLETAVAAVEAEWGRIDVLVNNARFIGPGHMDTVLDTSPDILLQHLRGNVLAPLALDRLVLPGMIARGSGTIIHLTSAASFSDTTKPIGSGGWGLSYGVSKGAIHRLAGYVVTEHGDDGIRCFNLQPGTIATERIAQDMGRVGIANKGEPADVVGAVAAWLATSPDAARLNGRTIEAPFLCHELGLLDDWAGPTLIVQGRHDISAELLTRMEAALAEGTEIPSHFTP
ncbi:SDR family NAD(P)-dependent oxidoreductase [soil metagenome]